MVRGDVAAGIVAKVLGASFSAATLAFLDLPQYFNNDSFWESMKGSPIPFAELGIGGREFYKQCVSQE